MTNQQIEAKARQFAAETKWEPDAAITFIIELLTDINMHAVCAKFQAILVEEDLTNGANLTTPEAWNDLHDAEWQITNDLHDLDRQYARRNWTASDWNSYKLVAANVD